MQQSAEEIIKEIKAGFTGDTEKDIPYLQEKMDIYLEHEQGDVIIRECSRMLYDMTASLEKKENDKLEEVHKHMKELRVYMEQGDLKSAMRLCDELVKRADQNASYVDNEKCEYYSFTEFFQEIMVKEFMTSGREIVKTEFPFADIYFQQGLLLMAKDKMAEAQEAFAKARRWNPVSAPIAFAYMDTFLGMGKMEEFVELSREIFPFLYKASDVAKCYYYFANYFVSKQEWRVAAGCCELSLQYAPEDGETQALSDEIQRNAGSGFRAPKRKEMEKMAEKYDFRLTPNDNIINLAVGLGEQFMNQQALDGALYCFEIVYDLTRDEKIGELVKQMKILTPMI